MKKWKGQNGRVGTLRSWEDENDRETGV